MDYKECVQSKVEIVFQIAGRYMSDQLAPAQAREQLGSEMENIRPAQLDAVKAELGKWLREAGSLIKTEKLFDLFKPYLPLPYHNLAKGHPLKNYYEENGCVRNFLLEIDNMEGEEASVDAWRNIYALMKKYEIHVKRLEKNFFPFMVSAGFRLQVEKAKGSAKQLVDQIQTNIDRLDGEDIIEFLVDQRNLTKKASDYLDLEERVLFPKALSGLTQQDFQELRASDDLYGYVYISLPDEYVPEEEKTGTNPETVLQCQPDLTKRSPFIPDKIKQKLLKGEEKQITYLHNEGGNAFLITYSLLKETTGVPEMDRPAERSIDSSTCLSELFVSYPAFKEDFYDLDDELKDLRGQLGMEILKDATVGMLAKSLRMETNELTDKIIKLIENYR